MSHAATDIAAPTPRKQGESLWAKAVGKFRRDRWGMTSRAVVLVYFGIALGVWAGLWGDNWNTLTPTDTSSL